MTTLDDINYAAQMAHTGRVKTPAKKTYKKPEADVGKKIDAYLALIGCIVFRTNAGHWVTVEGYHIQGVPEGYADLHGCTPHGRFLAIETKAPKKGLKSNQEAYQSKVEAHSGTYIKASSVDELRAGLVKAYGPQTVADWEMLGQARSRAKKAQLEALKKGMGQT